MATDADARARGFATPAGTDPISNGDDAIRQNARAATDIAFKVEPLAQDSGWRMLPGSVQSNGWTMVIWCRRVGHLVELSVRNMSAANATGNNYMNLPAGLRASGVGPCEVLRQSGTQVGISEVAGAIGWTAQRPTNGYVNFVFTTTDAFPNPWPI